MSLVCWIVHTVQSFRILRLSPPTSSVVCARLSSQFLARAVCGGAGHASPCQCRPVSVPARVGAGPCRCRSVSVQVRVGAGPCRCRPVSVQARVGAGPCRCRFDGRRPVSVGHCAASLCRLNSANSSRGRPSGGRPAAVLVCRPRPRLLDPRRSAAKAAHRPPRGPGRGQGSVL